MKRHGLVVVLVAVVWLVFLSASCARESELHQAVLANDHERVQSLLDGGADVNTEDGDGFTALALAARQGDEGIVKLLLAKGAQPEYGDDPHKYPRAQAEIGGHEAIFHRLLFREAIEGSDPVRTYKAGPPENNDAYVQRVLAALGNVEAVGGLFDLNPEEIRNRAVDELATGEVSRETLLYLWIMDPITRRKSSVPYAAGECHVCISRHWHRPRGLTTIQSRGGCIAPPEIGVEHVVPTSKIRSELPKDDFVELVTRYGDGCSVPN